MASPRPGVTSETEEFESISVANVGVTAANGADASSNYVFVAASPGAVPAKVEEDFEVVSGADSDKRDDSETKAEAAEVGDGLLPDRDEKEIDFMDETAARAIAKRAEQRATADDTGFRKLLASCSQEPYGVFSSELFGSLFDAAVDAPAVAVLDADIFSSAEVPSKPSIPVEELISLQLEIRKMRLKEQELIAQQEEARLLIEQAQKAQLDLVSMQQQLGVVQREKISPLSAQLHQQLEEQLKAQINVPQLKAQLGGRAAGERKEFEEQMDAEMQRLLGLQEDRCSDLHPKRWEQWKSERLCALQEKITEAKKQLRKAKKAEKASLGQDTHETLDRQSEEAQSKLRELAEFTEQFKKRCETIEKSAPPPLQESIRAKHAYASIERELATVNRQLCWLYDRYKKEPMVVCVEMCEPVERARGMEKAQDEVARLEELEKARKGLMDAKFNKLIEIKGLEVMQLAMEAIIDTVPPIVSEAGLEELLGKLQQQKLAELKGELTRLADEKLDELLSKGLREHQQRTENDLELEQSKMERHAGTRRQALLPQTEESSELSSKRRMVAQERQKLQQLCLTSSRFLAGSLNCLQAEQALMLLNRGAPTVAESHHQLFSGKIDGEMVAVEEELASVEKRKCTLSDDLEEAIRVDRNLMDFRSEHIYTATSAKMRGRDAAAIGWGVVRPVRLPERDMQLVKPGSFEPSAGALVRRFERHEERGDSFGHPTGREGVVLDAVSPATSIVTLMQVQGAFKRGSELPSQPLTDSTEALAGSSLAQKADGRSCSQ